MMIQKNHVWVSEYGIWYVYVKRDKKGREENKSGKFLQFGSS